MLNKLINKKNKDSESGFTIIEVLIVLAIAGLILVVVLIAIPQLQRNQRNTARQNDAARVASSVSTWVANNNGSSVPTTGPTATAALTQITDDLGELNQYEVGDVEVTAWSSSVGAVGDLTTVRIVTGASCVEAGNGAVETASNRQYAVQYGIETGNSAVNGGCLDV